MAKSNHTKIDNRYNGKKTTFLEDLDLDIDDHGLFLGLLVTILRRWILPIVIILLLIRACVA
ncbi:MAG: hypothetical protein HUK23_05585 [Sphaerochaetaceae bacterium]|nr:hypothetical protein [Sphaerochaetaceae bacterium]